MAGIRVLSLSGGTVQSHPTAEVAALIGRPDTVVWVDIPECSDEAVDLLTEVLKCHPLAVRDCMQRNRVPRVRIYPHQQLLILHGPERGPSGHVHYLELDQIIGENYVVTVHGPINAALSVEVALRETDGVRRRLESGRLTPDSPYELSYAITSALVHRLETFIEEVTTDVWRLEQRVTSGHMGNPEEFLEELFQARHGLLAVRTMGALGAEVYGRVAALEARIPADDLPLVNDVVDQLNRIRGLADGEREYLQGVIEFYRARAETKMTIAAERLAVIAVVTLPITALSSIYGMNIIVNDRTHVAALIAVLIVMAVMSALLLTWAKRRGWW
ncbi:magnesium transporter CorA family protein [Actinoplanes sp. TBRC 11911]|uniref:magnesium transporter CorA family protein n=1 Tax=Actinoplanes sp. TBRC 11911 TaxID=2729386 RepID=UPI00145C4EC6|nr:magnesium transporter CorA family protein [Actinoplanes sp. TBRC 11911]NMO55058.1 magnesium transporter CorA family protein [Actinoplanes sp. TBRC 11911]